MTEHTFNEDTFNIELRKFLKKVGIRSQREIEAAIRAGVESGALANREFVNARMTLEIEDAGLEVSIDGKITLV